MSRAGGLALGIALAVAGCARDPLAMTEQPRYPPYARNAHYDDGRAMRPPVAGTVAEEDDAGAPALLTGREGGKTVARFPLPVDRALVERGRHHFEITCAACHGLLGDGNTVVASKMSLRPPPSLVDGDPPSPGDLFVVASQGYGVMPGYADVLSVRDRWAVAAYVLALRASQRTPAADLPDDVRRRLEAAP